MKTFFNAIFCLVFSSFIFSQVEWQKHGSPVLDLGTFPSWDDNNVGFGSIIYDGTTYKMWYSGARSDFTLQIGYAESTDGITWDKDSSNPVMTFGTPGSFDEGSLWGSSVIFDEGIYKMWYTGSSPTTFAYWRIGYATSSDGINWTKHPTPVLDVGSPGEWDDFHIAMPSVRKENNIYKMWYHGGRSYETGHIGYAESSDGITWTKYNDPSTPNPPNAESDPVFMTGASGTWNSIVVWQPYVIYNNVLQSYEMWYVAQGSDPSYPGQSMGYASSTDGIYWNEYGTTPVMTGTPGSFDHQSLLAPCVLFDGTDYQMWYTGNYFNINWRIGYATAYLTVPVELESFTAVQSGNNINLNWVTATELNNHGFELFRNGNKIAFIEGKGTTTEKQEYLYEDKNLHPGIYNYRLEQIDFDGKRTISSEITVYLTLPETFSLEQNYPNPFNPSTVIGYQLPASGNVTLKVYDLLGREVAVLVDEYKPAGRYEVEFDASQLSSGVYIYRLTTENYSASNKMTLLR